MPTITFESAALPNVRKGGMQPASDQTAAVMSIPLPLVGRVRSHSRKLEDWLVPPRRAGPKARAAPEASASTALNNSVRRAASDGEGHFARRPE